MTTLTTLPLDVLRYILHESNVQDVFRIGMTCKALQNAIQDHHVWLPRAKEYRALVPVLNHYEPPITTFPTEELKGQAIHQAKLTSRWQRKALEPVFTTFIEPDDVFFATLLPGGDHLVIVFASGDISLRSLDKLSDCSNPYLMSIMAESLDTLEREDDSSELVQVEALYTLEHGLLLSLIFGRHDSYHQRFQVYHVDTFKPSVTMVRSIEIQYCMVLGACAQRDVLACMYRSEGILYVLIASLEHSATIVLKPEFPPGAVGCDICMPSPHTLIIYGNSYIRIYHIPDIDLSSSRSQHQAVNIRPIWAWKGSMKENEFRPNITVWDGSCKEPPIVHLVSEAFMHVLTFGFTKNPTRLVVASHQMVLVDLPSQQHLHLTLKCQKGVWHYLDGSASTFNFRTMALDDPNLLGSIRFEMNESDGRNSLFEGLDFDEVSGRLLLLSSNIDGSIGSYYLHVADIIEL